MVLKQRENADVTSQGCNLGNPKVAAAKKRQPTVSPPAIEE